ncbi:MAG: RluA family pseudouridine synthase [Christensenella sp.]|uniref:RluA family pseudouridine synthase n=1 Tax=Christensenella sp. TaxID=1935934 RepID=UPI002B2183AA|nr:RluA family pseudouridine synthase [Christensenella sp.]MEA5003105.1 RluA family pseudouridine synthase [Christensenella sp.]
MTPHILYEDNHLLVAIKPQNMPSQADSSRDIDFLNLLKQYIKEKYQKPGEVYLGLVHRLDRPAGGVMVFARTSKAAARLSAQLKDGSFQKKYYAVVSDTLPLSGTLEDHLLKDGDTNTTSVVLPDTPGAKRALLDYDTAAQKDNLTLLSITLRTGRSHQIRVQLAHAGAPLLGDVKYGGKNAKNLCLWSYSLSILHPTKKERLTFTCPPPSAYPWDMWDITAPS